MSLCRNFGMKSFIIFVTMTRQKYDYGLKTDIASKRVVLLKYVFFFLLGHARKHDDFKDHSLVYLAGISAKTMTSFQNYVHT